MKVIIAGSRSLTDKKTVWNVIRRAFKETGWIPDLIISGGAEGVDQLGEEWARKKELPIQIIPAKWDEYGKSAGPQRNATMADRADALVAVWDGKSSGTKDMISKAVTAGLPYCVVDVSSGDVHYDEDPEFRDEPHPDEDPAVQ